MTRILLIQSMVFFLFFYPPVLIHSWLRRLVLVISLGLTTLYFRSDGMDPFAWVFYLTALLFLYATSRKTFRWVFLNRLSVRQKLERTRRVLDDINSKTQNASQIISALEVQIDRRSRIYEKLKDLSGLLEVKEMFSTFAEAALESFPLRRVRLILLKSNSDKPVIDSVCQLDAKWRHAHHSSKNPLVTDDIKLQGEIYPADIQVLSQMMASAELSHKKVTETSALLCAIRVDKNLEGVLSLEFEPGREDAMAEILVERFIAEYRRVKLYDDVQLMATTDWLTGLYVRRYFFGRLEEEFKRSERFGLVFSFLMIDIDDFKGLNDKYGHLVGDALLKETAALIKTNVREVDLVGRYGGEEFAAILVDTKADQAMDVSQRIRNSIASHKYRVFDEELNISVSIGFATYTPQNKDPQVIVEWADSALYQAKRQGKNRVCAFIPHNAAL